MAAEHLLEFGKCMLHGLDTFSNCVKNSIALVRSSCSGGNCHLKIGGRYSDCLKLEKMIAEHLLEFGKCLVPVLDNFSNCVENAIASVSSFCNGSNCHLKIRDATVDA